MKATRIWLGSGLAQTGKGSLFKLPPPTKLSLMAAVLPRRQLLSSTSVTTGPLTGAGQETLSSQIEKCATSSGQEVRLLEGTPIPAQSQAKGPSSARVRKLPPTATRVSYQRLSKKLDFIDVEAIRYFENRNRYWMHRDFFLKTFAPGQWVGVADDGRILKTGDCEGDVLEAIGAVGYQYLQSAYCVRVAHENEPPGISLVADPGGLAESGVQYDDVLLDPACFPLSHEREVGEWVKVDEVPPKFLLSGYDSKIFYPFLQAPVLWPGSKRAAVGEGLLGTFVVDTASPVTKITAPFASQLQESSGVYDPVLDPVGFRLLAILGIPVRAVISSPPDPHANVNILGASWLRKCRAILDFRNGQGSFTLHPSSVPPPAR